MGLEDFRQDSASQCTIQPSLCSFHSNLEVFSRLVTYKSLMERVIKQLGIVSVLFESEVKLVNARNQILQRPNVHVSTHGPAEASE